MVLGENERAAAISVRPLRTTTTKARSFCRLQPNHFTIKLAALLCSLAPPHLSLSEFPSPDDAGVRGNKFRCQHDRERPARVQRVVRECGELSPTRLPRLTTKCSRVSRSMPCACHEKKGCSWCRDNVELLLYVAPGNSCHICSVSFAR